MGFDCALFRPWGRDFHDGRRADSTLGRTPAERLGLNRQQMRLWQRNFHSQRAGFLRKRFVYKH
jgi:hypothetical protein